MNRGKIILSIISIIMLIMTSIGTYGSHLSYDSIESKQTTISVLGEDVGGKILSLISDIPSAIAVTDEDPFYALIATPLAVHYDEEGVQEVIPFFIKNFDDPSKAVVRAEDQIGISVDYEINGSMPVKETSLAVAEEFWDDSASILLIEYNGTGYNLGVVATPIASYLSIPVIVTDEVDQDVNGVLDMLGVEHVYICGDLECVLPTTHFESVDEIINETIAIIETRLEDTVQYITMANPMDITMPEVLDTETFTFNDETVGSGVVLPTQFINSILKQNTLATHNFTIPNDYKYTKLIVDLENLEDQNVELLGDQMYVMVLSPEPDLHRYVYAATGGGLPVRDENGSILEDRIHFEVTIYDNPGEYQVWVLGHWFAATEGSYNLKVTLEKLDSVYVPLMKYLSSTAPYFTAYHKGIIFAEPEFAFAADDDVIYNGSTCPGIAQPGTNDKLIVPSNNHTMGIHDELNELLAQIAGIPVENLEELRDHYAENPIYIAISADPTMVPMYFYYNPDGRPDTPAHIMGFAVPSDFIYGDIDPKPDDPENNTYTYWPFQENIVGRVTGNNVQDCSALIARTIFYDDIIASMGDWKNNALVQTGCGLEFQNLPLATRFSQALYSGRGEPTKFPTGESTFINMKLVEDMETGEFNVKSTKYLQSQLEGFSEEGLEAIKNLGILNKLIFPKRFIEMLSSEDVVTGGEDQLNSNLVFAFAHGFYNLYEFGDILLGCRGFPFVTTFARIYPSFGSRLSEKGNFEIRALENMEYGPSVVYIESCITARTDGMNPENTLSQTYIHNGANAYIGATRVTADPGYLDPRPLPGGLGFGILGLMNATLRYKLLGEYPDLHFGAVIAEDFILELIDDKTTGLALRNAKNMYLEKDANNTFLWSPPLTLARGHEFAFDEYLNSLEQSANGDDRTKVLTKKYVALHEFTLYGDPAFNPYQPVNNG